MLVLNSKPKNNTKRKTTLSPITPKSNLNKRIKKAIDKIFEPMYEETNELVKSDADTSKVIRELKKISKKYKEIANEWSIKIGKKWAKDVSVDSRDELYRQIKKHLMIDRGYIVDSSEFEEAFKRNLVECVHLIRSIPVEYLGKVAEALMKEFNGEPQPDNRTLVEQIQKEGKIAKERAKFIARDQTAKMNSQFNQVRQQDLGIEEYIWRTAQDQRVVGNPNGRFPNWNQKHGNHYSRNGKIFRWDSPPEDGHPGMAINCRCVAIPIIDFDKLKRKDDY